MRLELAEKRILESELTADAKAMLETYGKKVDFVDFDALQAIVEIVKA